MGKFSTNVNFPACKKVNHVKKKKKKTENNNTVRSKNGITRWIKYYRSFSYTLIGLNYELLPYV